MEFLMVKFVLPKYIILRITNLMNIKLNKFKATKVNLRTLKNMEKEYINMKKSFPQGKINTCQYQGNGKMTS